MYYQAKLDVASSGEFNEEIDVNTIPNKCPKCGYNLIKNGIDEIYNANTLEYKYSLCPNCKVRFNIVGREKL